MAELDFTTANSLYATHGLHPFGAKCPPQLARYGIKYYSKPGETVIDPMMGSGTTLLEARIMGRNAVGYDIDPLAKLVAGAKCTVVPDGPIELAFETVQKRSARDAATLRGDVRNGAARRRATPPDFPRRDFWFQPEICEGLSLLSYHISELQSAPSVRNFLWTAFSSLILSRTSVANARDIVHSRPHYYRHPEPPDVLGRFEKRVRRMRNQMREYRDTYAAARTTVAVRAGDSRQLRIAEESVDLVFTSPPYVTALDYTRAHFLAIPWMQAVLGIRPSEYGELAPRFIGSEKGNLGRGPFCLSEELANLEQGVSALTQLAQISVRHAKLAQRYFLDMRDTLRTCFRVLKPGRHAIIVVCPSHIRKVHIPTQQVLIEIARSIGFRIKRHHERTISERRRVLPYLPDEFGQRMSTEYVLVFQKL